MAKNPTKIKDLASGTELTIKRNGIKLSKEEVQKFTDNTNA